MAVTLLQATLDQRPGAADNVFVQMFNQFSPIVEEAPAVGIDDLWTDYEQAVTLPSISWRALNEPFAESSGVTATYREYLKIIGGEVKIDVELLNSPRGRTTVTKQTRMKMLAAANELDRAVLEGSEINSVKEMVGFRARLSGNQLILNASGGGALTLAKLRELVSAVKFTTRQQPGMKFGQGIRKVLYMNNTMRSKIDALMEAQTGSKQITVTNDTFGRRVEMFDDAIIRVVEEQGTGNTILGFDEDPGDGTADCTSIYCVAWGEETCHLLYRKGSNDGKALSVFRVPQMEAEPRMLLRVSGMFGLSIPEPRAAARLHAITNA